MITLIDGQTGSGKTWLMSRLLYGEWLQGANIYANYPLFFSDEQERVNIWHLLPEIYHLQKGVIGIDEAQKLFDARRWQSLPMSFAEMIAQHRHQYLDIITTTQDIGHVDLRFRALVHDRYTCQTILRLPVNERVEPLIQWIRVIHRKRHYVESTDRTSWVAVSRPKWYFISRFWTKKLYNTYHKIGLSKFICRCEYMLKAGKTKANWKVRITSRDLINMGRYRK